MSQLESELYTLLHRGYPGDVRHYLQACRGAARVLELGAGHGRLVVPLARQGSNVTALDCSASILELGQRAARAAGVDVEQRITWLCGDMVAPSLEGLFDRIVIAHNTLYCLRSSEEVRACLTSARERLAPQGELLLDVYCADTFHHEDRDEHDDGEFEPLVTVSHDGVTYDVLEASCWHREEQRLDVLYRYIPRGAGEPIEQSIVHHYLLAEQLEALIEQAGLSVRTAYGGFAGEELSAGAEVVVMALIAANEATP